MHGIKENSCEKPQQKQLMPWPWRITNQQKLVHLH